MPIKGLSFNNAAFRGPVRVAALFACAMILITAWSSAHAQKKTLDSAVLLDSTTSIPLGKYTTIQKDPDGLITPQSIRESMGRNLTGYLSEEETIHLGNKKTNVWLAVKIQNQSVQTSWMLDIGRRTEGRLGNVIDLKIYEFGYISNPDGSHIANLSEIKPSSESSVYKLNIPRNQKKLYLINVLTSSGLPTVLPLKIHSESEFMSHMFIQYSVNTFYGMILVSFALIFGAIAFFHQKPKTLIFTGYYLYCALMWAVYILLSSSIGFTYFLTFLMIALLGLSLLQIYMTKLFCNIEYGSFTEKYVLYGLIWLNVLFTMLFLILPVTSGSASLFMPFSAPLITMVLLATMTFAQTKSGHLPSYLFFASWLTVIAGFGISALGIYNVLPQESFILNAYWYFLPVQGIYIILAVVQKIKMTAEEDSFARLSTGNDALRLNKLRETKDNADHSRLLKVIEKEREMLADFRTKEITRTEEMRKAKEAADEANRAKSAFLAVVSHEIRTPMTGIMGMVRLLMDSNITKQQRDYVMTIQESSEAMLSLLNDILDFEKIQQGKIELENISFDLHRLIQGVVTLMSGHATEKGIALSARMDDNLPKFVKGDPTRLRQVLLNLMGNAIKFTSQGSVTLFVKNLEAPDQNGVVPDNVEKYMIYFGVQDTGIGVSSEAQKNLFNPFSQANSTIARKYGGTGLGLAISKGLIERMKSSININSKEKEGSTFFFTLEMDKGLSHVQDKPKKALSALEEENIQPLKIMVVDDNAITRKVVHGFLEPSPHQIDGCGSAEEALDKIYKYPYDLIFMDIELTGMRGNEATKLLREYGDPAKAQIPVIAMTGNVSKEDMESYLTDGMSGFISKPIDREKLRSIVNEVARKSFEREIKAPGGFIPVPPTMDAPHTEDSSPDHTSEEEDINLEGIFNPEMLQSLKDTIGAAPLIDLLGDLTAKTEEILASMSHAVDIGDLKSLAARAHELKGMAGNFGLVEISTIAAQTERKAKLEETSGLEDLIKSLPEANVRAQGALKHWVTH